MRSLWQSLSIRLRRLYRSARRACRAFAHDVAWMTVLEQDPAAWQIWLQARAQEQAKVESIRRARHRRIDTRCKALASDRLPNH